MIPGPDAHFVRHANVLCDRGELLEMVRGALRRSHKVSNCAFNVVAVAVAAVVVAISSSSSSSSLSSSLLFS